MSCLIEQSEPDEQAHKEAKWGILHHGFPRERFGVPVMANAPKGIKKSKSHANIILHGSVWPKNDEENDREDNA